MIERPVLSPIYSFDIQQDKVLLSANEEYTVLEGQVCSAIFPFLDGRYSIDQIVDQLKEEFGAAVIHYTLMLMEDEGYLVDYRDLISTEKYHFWQNFGLDPVLVQNEFEQNSVEIVTLGIDSKSILQEALKDLGITSYQGARYKVFITSDYLNPSFESFNQEAILQNKSYLIICILSTKILVGPVITPGQGGCWYCLKHRIELNRPADLYFRQKDSSIPKEEEPPEAVVNLGFHVAALEISKWLASPSTYPLENQLVCIDLKNLESSRHYFKRRPQCPACQNKPIQKTKRLILTPRPLSSQNSTLRVQSTEATYERLKHIVSPITGIVRSLREVKTSEIPNIYNYSAGHSARIKAHSIESLRLNTRDHSGGKGKNNIEAKVSAICESVERYCAVIDGDEPDLTASIRDLGEQCIHPASILLFSESQYEHRKEWNRNQSGSFQKIPEPIDDFEAIAWTEAWSLSDDKPYYVPTTICYYGFDGPGSNYARADSNGLAAGNCLEEAILHGFLELVERDAVSIWWYNRTRHPKVDLSKFNDPYFEALVKSYRELDRELWVLDITHDLEIPSFVAVSRKTKGESEDILLGFGTHLYPQIAVTRALLEINQSLPAVLRTKEERENQLLPDFADAIYWWNFATLKDHPYLDPIPPISSISPQMSPLFNSLDLKDQIIECVERVKNRGLNTFVVDLSRPDIDLSVVRVIVPGLRHFWRRLAPGRLYEVPVLLNRIDKANCENELNPISLFL